MEEMFAQLIENPYVLIGLIVLLIIAIIANLYTKAQSEGKNAIQLVTGILKDQGILSEVGITVDKAVEMVTAKAIENLQLKQNEKNQKAITFAITMLKSGWFKSIAVKSVKAQFEKLGKKVD